MTEDPGLDALFQIGPPPDAVELDRLPGGLDDPARSADDDADKPGDGDVR